MTIVCTLSTLLFIAAIALLLRLTPERIANDLTRIINPEQSLRNRARIAQGSKKSRKIALGFAAIRDAMKATGKERQFTLVCAASLLLCVGGIMFALFIGNVFLMPVLAAGMSALPFLYAKSTLNYYKRHVDEEIEEALSIISTAYVRSVISL